MSDEAPGIDPTSSVPKHLQLKDLLGRMIADGLEPGSPIPSERDLAEQYGLRQVTDELCAEEGLTPDIVFEATEIPTMEGLVAAGFGVAVVPVPRDDSGSAKTVHVALTNGGAKREVGLVWERDRPLSPPARRFSDFLVASEQP